MSILPPPGVPDEFTRGVAVDALALARKNEQEINAHEDLCAERYANIRAEIAGLRAIFKWMGGAAFTLILFGLGVLINQMTTANQALTERNAAATIAATRIELLQDALAKERGLPQHTGAPK